MKPIPSRDTDRKCAPGRRGITTLAADGRGADVWGWHLGAFAGVVLARDRERDAAA